MTNFSKELAHKDINKCASVLPLTLTLIPDHCSDTQSKLFLHLASQPTGKS